MQTELQQRQVQKQTQVLSQKQIHSLEYLSLGADDLREAVYREQEENPALEIVSDARSDFSSRYGRSSTVTGRSTAAGNESSDRFQQAIEARPDTRETLQDHLISQINMLNLEEAENILCRRLVENLDEKGFHILSPVTLLEKNDTRFTGSLLERCMNLIQNLDPIGTCTSGICESLMVQAKASENPPRLALYILDGKLDFLDPPKADKILKKISEHERERKSMFAAREPKFPVRNSDLTEGNVEAALAFIRSLDPYPASNFSSATTHYIFPDIFVRRNESGELFVAADDFSIPEIRVNPELEIMSGQEKSAAMEDKLKKAQEFIDMLEFRNGTLLNAAKIILEVQKEFFLLGPGHLSPMKQSDLAEKLGVHESTVSRLASGKYIHCEWGLFPLKYFFTHQVSESGNGTSFSHDNILAAIKEIIASNPDKKLSDQKISDILLERGIKVARRTVSKYRGQLNIDSSYNR